MALPKTYTDKNETGCCPIPNVNEWDKKEIEFKHKKFIRMYTKSFLYVPLNMAKVMTSIQKISADAKAEMPKEEGLILSRVISPWKSEQLYAVSKKVDGADNIELTGKFLTMVFDGPYSKAQKWHKELVDYAKDKQDTVKKVYFFYTTCPKCAKHYGHNYTIGFAEI